MTDEKTVHTSWIWLDRIPDQAINYYADFYRVIHVGHLGGLWSLRISVDSNFAAWLNGAYIGSGQYSDFPDDRTFSTIDLTPLIQQGQNELAIQVYYCGVDNSSYIPGGAGLWYELDKDGEVVVRSDSQTMSRLSKQYTSETTTRMTPQRGFTFHYAALPGPTWQMPEHVCDEAWTAPQVITCNQQPRPRPVKMLDTSESVAGVVVAQGLLQRGSSKNVSVQMQRDFLSARHPWELFENQSPTSKLVSGSVTLVSDRLEGSDGFYLVYDLGREVCGFLNLCLSASDSCVIDTSVGEHLDDLRVRSSVGGRCFASRYVACEGKQSFTHWHHRYAGRYIQVHITGLRGELRLERVGLVAAKYSVEEVGRFESPDSLANNVWRTSIQTLRLCMYEHYEDCPWREQALYANDMRNQMLSGFYVFGDHNFPRASLELLRKSIGIDGYTTLCAPMRSAYTIPGFTMAWLLSVCDYYLFGGDDGYIHQVLPDIKRMMGCFQSTLVNDALPCPRGDGYWHFYDWASGLDGSDPAEANGLNLVEGIRFDAPLNALWLMAVRAVGKVSEYIGDHTYAAECRSLVENSAAAIHNLFFDNAEGCYRTYVGDSASPHFAELTQALMLLTGTGDKALSNSLRQRLISGDHLLVTTTLSQSLYKYEAVLQDPALGPAVWSAIMDRWSPMLLKGASSFWETEQGGWDFHHAGSLCHGWSAIPAYFFGAYGLGIKPIEPGYRRVLVNPVFDLEHLRGCIPTPMGEIALQLNREGERWSLQISHPEGIDVVVDPERISVVSAETLDRGHDQTQATQA